MNPLNRFLSFFYHTLGSVLGIGLGHSGQMKLVNPLYTACVLECVCEAGETLKRLEISMNKA